MTIFLLYVSIAIHIIFILLAILVGMRTSNNLLTVGLKMELVFWIGLLIVSMTTSSEITAQDLISLVIINNMIRSTLIFFMLVKWCYSDTDE